MRALRIGSIGEHRDDVVALLTIPHHALEWNSYPFVVATPFQHGRAMSRGICPLPVTAL